MHKLIIGYGNTTVDLLSTKDPNQLYQGKPINGMRMPGGIMNVGKGWLAFFPNDNLRYRVTMVAKYGNDEFSQVIEDALRKEKFDRRFIERLDSESRVYDIGLTDPKNPDIKRRLSAEVLQSTPPIDVTPYLNQAAIVFTQSFATYSESLVADKIIEIKRTVYNMNKLTAHDMNIRQASLDALQGKGKAVSPTEVKQRQRDLKDKVERGLRVLRILKTNAEEAKVLDDSFQTKKPIKDLHLENSELPKIANSIMTTYSNLAMLVISNGEKGGYFMTRDFEIEYEALVLPRFINSLGCGDGLDAGITAGKIVGIKDSGIAALGPLTAALYTPFPSGYPEHLDNRILLRTIEEKRDYCEKIGADPDEILDKLRSV